MSKQKNISVCGTEPESDSEQQTASGAVSLLPADQVTREVLHLRALQLAIEPPSEETAEDTVELVEFSLGSERYAVVSSFVREVTSVRTITPVPCTPPFVRGLINLRGEVVSVVDLKKLFGLPESELTSQSRVVILRDDQMEFGILADTVPGVRSVALNSVQRTLPTLVDVRAKYLWGVTEDRLAVLDATTILGDDQLMVHDDL